MIINICPGTPKNHCRGLAVLGKPDLSIITFGSQEIDIYAVAERLTTRGWLVGLCREPRAIHLMMSLNHEPVREEYLAHLNTAMAEVKSGLGTSEKMKATY